MSPQETAKGNITPLAKEAHDEILTASIAIAGTKGVSVKEAPQGRAECKSAQAPEVGDPEHRVTSEGAP
ncbi:hypothetical protein AA0472_2707 [Acetobacter estunensis NRIC 0472]|nr:hypothetical protein AA0472_2707 [Acetobacter estunensis NRIC 0472]